MTDRILSVDLGDVRTGIAVSDPLGMLANGVCTVRMTDKEKIAEMVVGYVKQYGATKIILGLPVNMNGSHGPRAENAKEFSEVAKKYELLLVPSDSFGCPGYVRISYCVTTEQIKRALPSFKRLAEAYGL